MRSVIKDLGAFIRSDFNLLLYSFFFISLFIVILFNYKLHLYEEFLNYKVTGYDRVFRFFLLFSVPWFMIAIPKLLLSKKAGVLKNRNFYFSIVLILLIISLDSASIIFKSALKVAHTFDEQLYMSKIGSNIQGITLLILTIVIIIVLFRKIKPSDMGLLIKGVNLKPYFILIIFIVPMIVWASFKPDFIATYPVYKPWQLPVLFKIPKFITALIYEFLYGFDFISIEFTFRGLLVILMAKYMGKAAILPMAAVYCFLHLGKPEAEAISSVFGGYFLGVVALNTRSIAPGVILHVALAMMMDIAAYIQHFAK